MGFTELSTYPEIAYIELESGSILTVSDFTKIYFGDYHHVRLEISGVIKSSRTDSTASYRKVLEKMAVPSSELENVRQALLSEFTNHAIKYMNSPEFPDKFISAASSKRKVVKNYQGIVSGA